MPTTNGQEQAPPWVPYSRTTNATATCDRCGATTSGPGRAGWVHRAKPALTPGYLVGRAHESQCASCAERGT